MNISPPLQFDKTFNPNVLKELNEIDNENYENNEFLENTAHFTYDSERKTMVSN